MKKTLLTITAGFIVLVACAQQKQGRVVYQRTIQMQMRFQGMGDEVAHMLPRSRTDKLEVLFANDQSLRRTVQDETPADETTGGEGGVQIRMMVAGANDISYVNFGTGR